MDSPNLPPQLVQRLAQFRSQMFRIDLLRRNGKGWVKVDAFAVDPAGTDDTAELGERVIARARKDVESVGSGSRYRTLLWRTVLHEKEKRVATFNVETWYERRERERAERRSRRRRREARTPLEAQQILLEEMVDFNEHRLDQVVEMGRIQERKRTRRLASLGRFLALYEAGVQMYDETAQMLAHQRVLTKVAETRQRMSEDLWAEWGPMLETVGQYAARQVQALEQRSRATTGEAMTPVRPMPVNVVAPRGPSTRRGEATSPGSGDAASPGKDEPGP